MSRCCGFVVQQQIEQVEVRTYRHPFAESHGALQASRVDGPLSFVQLSAIGHNTSFTDDFLRGKFQRVGFILKSSLSLQAEYRVQHLDRFSETKSVFLCTC